MRARELLALNRSVIASAKSGSVLSLLGKLAQGATPDFQDERDQHLTALHHAARWGHVAVCKSLLKAGWGLEARSLTGHTPLSMAVFSARLDVCRALVQCRANMDMTLNEQGETLLHLCARKRESGRAVGLFLISKGARLNGVDSQGNTPLHEAAVWGDLAFTRALVEAGADPDVRNAQGLTCEEVASQYKHEQYRGLMAALKASVAIHQVLNFRSFRSATCSSCF